MTDNADYIFQSSQHLTHEAIKKYKIPICKPGDVVLSFKLTLGRIGIIANEMVTNEAIASFKTNDINRYYLFCFLKKYDFNSKMESTSSIGKAFNSSLLKQLQFLYPSVENLTSFNSTVKPLFDEILQIRKKIMKLSSLKHQLLSKYF